MMPPAVHRSHNGYRPEGCSNEPSSPSICPFALWPCEQILNRSWSQRRKQCDLNEGHEGLWVHTVFIVWLHDSCLTLILSCKPIWAKYMLQNSVTDSLCLEEARESYLRVYTCRKSNKQKTPSQKVGSCPPRLCCLVQCVAAGFIRAPQQLRSPLRTCQVIHSGGSGWGFAGRLFSCIFAAAWQPSRLLNNPIPCEIDVSPPCLSLCLPAR